MSCVVEKLNILMAITSETVDLADLSAQLKSFLYERNQLETQIKEALSVNLEHHALLALANIYLSVFSFE